MLIIALILFGMVIGAAAQLIVGRPQGRIDWPMAFVSGLVGSFVGGLLASLIAGDGLAIRPSGIIGSIVGAIVVTLIWRLVRSRQQA
ncbi:GlsB/YeaQ/YmgE family stress response membrane protein [Nocardioides insulae]|uniref:GlsB/YeaQ/YmgE family stress response membrane protein n=1 Tax=Nocardioides insulae TaxID=394734 RepID=UPI000428F7AF|nr:GlsB/YeaQ/YmgE family stress response membrane protein [Nocardioides insulae]